MGHAASAQAGANIAFLKYWGNRSLGQNLPLNPSISMTLAECISRTTVELLQEGDGDRIVLDGRQVGEAARRRVETVLDRVRDLAGRRERVRVESANTFPMGCGIASSASGFAALALAAVAAFGLDLDRRTLSRLARLGSGSAARSVFGGFVELRPGSCDEEAFAEQLQPESHWPELRDVVVIVSRDEKPTSSAEGHLLAHTSEMLQGRLAGAAARAERIRRAIAERDLPGLGEAAEEDALSMHAVMMTSRPPLLYWAPGTLEVIRLVWEMRKEGVEAYFTIDAGPNVHLLTAEKDLSQVEERVCRDLGFPTIADRPGPGAQVLERDDR